MIINLGSCCIDHVYQVPDFVRPGETLPCTSYEMHPGGKGLNQTIAMSRAGAAVCHAGKIGTDGLWLKSLMDEHQVDTSRLLVDDSPSGHANIQVSSTGENAIVLFGGTNQLITADEISDMLQDTKAGDFLVLQNEISELETAINLASEKGLRIIFNAAPMTAGVLDLPLSRIELLVINEIEGAALSGQQAADDILQALNAQYPETNILLTLGPDGARFSGAAGSLEASPPSVNAVDTTGAGDTFTGFFVAEYARGAPIESALSVACAAAAISVTRRGAASSIPTRGEVDQLIMTRVRD